MARKPKLKPISLDAWAAEVGARIVPAAGSGASAYGIDTRAGYLFIFPYYTWIACRFESVERAREHFGVTHIGVDRLNPYSGKWNFHADWNKESVAAMVEQFKREVAPLLC
jgi:hypothetical protein